MRKPRIEHKWAWLGDKLAPLVMGQRASIPYSPTAQTLTLRLAKRWGRKFITRRIGDSLEITRVEKTEEPS